jgi:hypothetical protein
VKETRPKGMTLTLVCGHEIKWPRPMTSTLSVWCPTCGETRKIESVK